MTFSICVHEPYRDAADRDQHRFGVAVTTRLAGVGTLCPFASDSGAVATQSEVNVDLGRRGIAYIDDGLAVDDALSALLNADQSRASRQLHGVDASGTFAFSGEECQDWYGHETGETYSVAGNLLTGPAVLEETATAYERTAPAPGTAGDRPLAARLIDALAAGHEAGGDKRIDLPIHSAALLVRTTESRPFDPYHDDLRVDATKTPIVDLRHTYELAAESFEQAVATYGDDWG